MSDDTQSFKPSSGVAARLASDEVFGWPEYAALVERLGFRQPTEAGKVVIELEAGRPAKVTHHPPPESVDDAARRGYNDLGPRSRY